MRGRSCFIGGLCLAVFLFAVVAARAQGTAFTYQGQLDASGSPASGSYDLTFALYNSTNVVSPVLAGPITNAAVPVTNGLFITALDFGPGIFTGTNYWLGVGVRVNGDTNAFTLLVPRQPILPVPYAIFANTASNLSGTLQSAQLSGSYSSAVTFSNSANNFAGTFSGNGTNLMNLNASQLTGGTVADARLSANVPLLNGNQTFTGANNFTNLYGNSFSGSFFGNGLVGWIATNGTAIQAQIDHGYLLTSPQLVTVTLPTTPAVGDIVRISGAGAGGWQTGQNTNQSIIGSFSSYANSYWTSVQTANNWQSVACSADGTKLVAITAGSGISVFSGTGWTAYTTVLNGGKAVASSADGNKLVALFNGSSGNNGNIYTFTNGATSWTKQTGAPTADWQAVASSADGTRLLAAINGGLMYVSTNSGVTWLSQTVNPASSQAWYSVAASADGNKLVAVAYGGGIYTNSGSSWSATSAPGSKNWISVASSADGSKLVAAVLNGGIYVSTDSGVTWPQTSAPTEPWTCVASSADGVKLAAVATNGVVYLSSNSGATWTQQTDAPAQYWISIASAADGSRLAAAVNNTSSGIYVSPSSTQLSSMTGTNGFISGGPGSAVELQYIGNGKFMPVSSAGTIWAN